jgi:hypothetical protein
MKLILTFLFFVFFGSFVSFAHAQKMLRTISINAVPAVGSLGSDLAPLLTGVSGVSRHALNDREIQTLAPKWDVKSGDPVVLIGVHYIITDPNGPGENAYVWTKAVLHPVRDTVTQSLPTIAQSSLDSMMDEYLQNHHLGPSITTPHPGEVRAY